MVFEKLEQRGEVGEFGGGTDNHIQTLSARVDVTFLLIVDEMSCAHAETVVFFGWGGGEGVDLGAESFRDLNPQMSESPNARDANLGARTHLGVLEWGVDCDAGTEEGGRLSRGDVVRDVKNKALVDARELSKATLVHVAIGKLSSKDLYRTGAIGLFLRTTVVTVAAGPNLVSGPSPVAHLKLLDIGSNFGHVPNNLVSWHQGTFVPGHSTLRKQDVSMTQAAVSHLQINQTTKTTTKHERFEKRGYGG